MAHMNTMMEEQPPTTVMSCTHRTVTAIEFDNRAAFICDGCLEMGYGSRYKCPNECDYDLHEECLTASPITHHPFFEQSFSLQRQESRNTSNLCIACGMPVKGLRYCQTNQRGSIYLHPYCMKMPFSITTDYGGMLFLKKKLVTVECKYCERTTLDGRIVGWAYISADEELACHIKCMKERSYEEWSMYAQQEAEEEEEVEEAYGGPEFDEGVGPSVAPSSPSRPVASGQPTQQYHNSQYHNGRQTEYFNYGRDMTATSPVGYHYAGPPQNSVPMTTTRPTSQKRRVLWELSKATASLLFDVTTVDPISTITAFNDLL